jgi:ABC-type uncharacterized transport system permease subunit
VETKKPFWKWVFCESDGTPSFARIGSAVLLGFVCGWVTAIVKWTHALPADFAGLGVFMMSLYGVNKFTTKFGKDQQ